MVIGIFGESCTGKSTLAEKIAASFPCEVYAGKDYLRLAKNENMAKHAIVPTEDDERNGKMAFGFTISILLREML